MAKHELWELRQKQSLPLEAKIKLAKFRIEQFYEHFDGQVYVSFSGGKDSTVLLHLVRGLYPEVEAVFIDTGLEFPEVREHVKTFENVTWVKPEKNFKDVVLENGYPIISKEVARSVQYARKGDTKSGIYYTKRFNGEHMYQGKKSQYNMEKWKFLLEAPFPISSNCCDVMKKRPAHKFEKQSGKHPIIGTLAVESRLRQQKWVQQGCNSFGSKYPKSNPLAVWTEQDILQYIKQFDLKIPSVYGDIVEVGGNLTTTKLDRTGCVFCGFGCHLEKSPNRFQRLKQTHPKLFDYCMKPVEDGGLGMGEVLDFIGVEH